MSSMVPKTSSTGHLSIHQFQQIFVINLRDRLDREDQWTLSARYANITFEYAEGRVGADMNIKAFPAVSIALKLCEISL